MLLKLFGFLATPALAVFGFIPFQPLSVSAAPVIMAQATEGSTNLQAQDSGAEITAPNPSKLVPDVSEPLRDIGVPAPRVSPPDVGNPSLQVNPPSQEGPAIRGTLQDGQTTNEGVRALW